MNKPVKRRVTILLDDNQFRELQILMEHSGMTSYTQYLIGLIYKEKHGELGGGAKRPVGRPKKIDDQEDKTLYPAPYIGGGAYTRGDWEGYYEFRGLEVPPLPKPLTKEELKKYN